MNRQSVKRSFMPIMILSETFWWDPASSAVLRQLNLPAEPFIWGRRAVEDGPCLRVSLSDKKAGAALPGRTGSGAVHLCL